MDKASHKLIFSRATNWKDNQDGGPCQFLSALPCMDSSFSKGSNDLSGHIGQVYDFVMILTNTRYPCLLLRAFGWSVTLKREQINSQYSFNIILTRNGVQALQSTEVFLEYACRVRDQKTQALRRIDLFLSTLLYPTSCQRTLAFCLVGHFFHRFSICEIRVSMQPFQSIDGRRIPACCLALKAFSSSSISFFSFLGAFKGFALPPAMRNDQYLSLMMLYLP